MYPQKFREENKFSLPKIDEKKKFMFHILLASKHLVAYTEGLLAMSPYVEDPPASNT